MEPALEVPGIAGERLTGKRAAHVEIVQGQEIFDLVPSHEGSAVLFVVRVRKIPHRSVTGSDQRFDRLGFHRERMVRVVERVDDGRSEEHTSELQSRVDLVCRLLLEKKKKK